MNKSNNNQPRAQASRGQKRKAAAPQGQPAPKRQRIQGPIGPQADSNFGGAPSSYAPVSQAREQRSRAPRIIRTSRGMRIQHRELVQTVNGSIAFTAQKLACNPGVAATFPWLAPQAVQWEQYRFNKLNFEYITRTATSTVGSVLLAPDYDPQDAAPTTEAQASSFQDVAENVAWKDICCVLRPDSMHALGPRKFVRSNPVVGADIKTYDVANLFLCTVEETGASAIGKLWVEYDVEFFVPQSSVASGAPTSGSSTSFYSQHAAQTIATATPTAVAWDTLISDPIGIGASAAGVFTPPQGAYRVEAFVCVTDSAAEAFNATIELQKNGASLASPIKATVGSLTAGNTYRFELSLGGLILASGTDTFRILATLTGAAGTLQVSADSAQLVISPA